MDLSEPAQPTRTTLVNLSGEAYSPDRHVHVGVTNARVVSVHIERALINPDRPHALEAAVRQAVNLALDDQDANFRAAFDRFVQENRDNHPELDAVHARFKSINERSEH